MKNLSTKLQIYHGIINYILDDTGYDLSNIAELSNMTIKDVRLIYERKKIPSNFFTSEKQLLQLYQIILELKHNKTTSKFVKFAKGFKCENTKYPTSC